MTEHRSVFYVLTLSIAPQTAAAIMVMLGQVWTILLANAIKFTTKRTTAHIRVIGLAIIKRIVSRHGGDVSAEGNVNEGASFHLTLPLAES
jgi:signal transduction histidine kinase